jgi:leader peptidase (prepilin peptidase)/N-methyltransferase
MELILSIFVVIFGLILGSFFNVLIWRLPREESIVWPGSHCPKCNRPIRALENIPVISYLFLRGRCAGCRQKISPLYPAVELITALCGLLLWNTLATTRSLVWQHDLFLALECLALLILIPVTIIDLQHYIIPNEITYTLIPLGLAASFLPGDTMPQYSIVGMLSGSGALYGIGLLGKVIFRKGEAMGLGDVKLLAGIGAIWGPKVALLTIMFGSVFGTLASIALIITRKLNKDHHIPFGPYLAAGVWTAVLAGDLIVDSYWAFVNNISFIGR